ncbi:LLM class flavin-dependent oxidoreductase [Lonepinella koalarum]|uniref:Luciferase-like monooxygenase n=1 Tax=Lonepinella koalarum TaxID=53417 RepID=A0A4R1KZX5_9PAST|nr:LLM class flavin-dependent oxidoreductase [Lonepinella koalarum]MDH2926002.1 luciferase [Lonepinella koalarum]TCK71155.1 luciferase family oxidoreductase group 1 [Lonepinella koalarum]TFJ90882.1 LLM class flavin-dependent oxidoreductase [Lonepinella koalarum]
MLNLSILNLVPLRQGQNFVQSVDAMTRLAQLAERLNFRRYWIAEHHNMPNMASSSTQLLIQHTLANTQNIIVGAGGVMLPNHSPLQVAEQYGTLSQLYPNRVEIGLGRAPGTDMRTAAALRRGNINPDFAQDIAELRRYFSEESRNDSVKAYMAIGQDVPIIILGSSPESAYLAAELGLPYAFASHFAPRFLEMAVEIYRREFKPSVVLAKPYVIVGANAIVAETDQKAESLATSQTKLFYGIVSGNMQQLQPPFASEQDFWQAHQSPFIGQEQQAVKSMTSCSFIGSPNSVKQQLQNFRKQVEFDELMAVSYIFDEKLQHRSYEMLAEVVKTL